MPTNVTLTSLRSKRHAGHARPRWPGAYAAGTPQRRAVRAALSGPYRFRGTFRSDGAERELRLATAPPEADGGIRMRASLRLADSGATYLLDARLADLMDKPRVDGQLSARLPIAGLWGTSAPPQPASAQAGRARGRDQIERGDAAFDLKSMIKADAERRGAFRSRAVVRAGRQAAARDRHVRINWREAVSLDMKLASRWLDLDRVTGQPGAGPRASPRSRPPCATCCRATPRASLASIRPTSPAKRSARCSFRSRVRLDRPKRIEYLRAGLPGGARGELKGTIAGPSDALEFKGTLNVRGTSERARFAAWATASGRGKAKTTAPSRSTPS